MLKGACGVHVMSSLPSDREKNDGTSGCETVSADDEKIYSCNLCNATYIPRDVRMLLPVFVAICEDVKAKCVGVNVIARVGARAKSPTFVEVMGRNVDNWYASGNGIPRA